MAPQSTARERGQQEQALHSAEHWDRGLLRATDTRTISTCVFLMHLLTCSGRHVHLREEGSRINGFTLCKEGCHLEEGSAAPQGLCEYVFSLKSTVPVVSFVPCKEPWLCSVPGLRCRWSLGQSSSIPQLTTTGFYSSRSDKSTKIKFKKRPRLQLPPESSFWGHQPQSQSNTPGPEGSSLLQQGWHSCELRRRAHKKK